MINSIYNVSNTDGVAGVSKYGSVFNVAKKFESPVSLGAISTLSSIDKRTQITLSNGNLTFSSSIDYAGVFSTGIYTTGKKEFWIYNDQSTRQMAGVATLAANLDNYPGADSEAVAVWASNGTVYKNGSTGQVIGGSIPDQTWFGVRHDADTGEVWFKRAADPSWILSLVTIATGKAYHAIVGTGNAGAADTSTVAFNSADFPEPIGEGFQIIREPAFDIYPRWNQSDRQDKNTALGPTWTSWSWKVARTMISNVGFSTGKYEFWVRNSSSSAFNRGMVGIGRSDTAKTAFPGTTTAAAAFWFFDGTMWCNNSKAGNPVLGALGLNNYVGIRFDIDGQTLQFNNNGASWNTQSNVNANVWAGGDVHLLIGTDGGAPNYTDYTLFPQVIFNPNDFPQTISVGYSPLIV